MTSARRDLIDPETTPFYHCITRCVRHAFLCGDNNAKLIGEKKDYSYRKEYIENRIQYLGGVFAIGVCAYGIMSNHYHVVLYIDQAQIDDCSDDDLPCFHWTQF